MYKLIMHQKIRLFQISKNFVIALGITIFLNEYVGIVLINIIETIIKDVGTNKS